MMGDLQNSFFAIGFLALLVALILLFMYFFRREHHGRLRTYQQSRDDLASMMLLLQTMRDLLDQQKQLARQLNASLDKKVTYIKETVDIALQDLADLREGVLRLAETVEETKARLRQTAEKEGEPQPGRPAAEHSPHLTIIEKHPTHDDERPALRVLAHPTPPPATDDVIETWVGLDFGGDEPDPLSFDVPETAPDSPQDAQAAREAFRALLNLNSEPARADEPKPSSGARSATHAGGNGRAASPLHTQVYEYNDAGMTITQIAQELGIGKGEVRLILSLRKDRSG